MTLRFPFLEGASVPPRDFSEWEDYSRQVTAFELDRYLPIW